MARTIDSESFEVEQLKREIAELHAQEAATDVFLAAARVRIRELEAAVIRLEAVVLHLRRVVEYVGHGACIMDAPDGPVCFCGLPSAHESGICHEHLKKK